MGETNLASINRWGREAGAGGGSREECKDKVMRYSTDIYDSHRLPVALSHGLQYAGVYNGVCIRFHFVGRRFS